VIDRINAGGWATQEPLPSIWQLPPDDDDYPTRWRLIKSHFSRSIAEENPYLRVANRKKKEEFGNGAIGSIGFVTSGICKTIWITFITILSSTAMYRELMSGHIHPFTNG